MVDKFDAFFIVKFLNSFDSQSAFPPIDVLEAARIIIAETFGVASIYAPHDINMLYEQILSLDNS